ncbi:MAG: TDP-N-acetylfucosamine:lipid II N-acetylfucosaminyltransferase [Melioribacteraceae bacterium]|nr:TDP-N-acetylfucosamine:lipid II N-acetylfucosaminyltransferase [Melioribacteraceae bacterium]
MFIHLLTESAYTYKYNQLIQSCFDINEHQFFIFGKSTWDKNENYSFYNSLKINNINDSNFVNKLKECTGIILHGMFSHEIVNLLFENQHLLSKTNWLLWGGDLYFYREVETGVITKEFEHKRKTIIKQLAYISCEVEGDFNIAKRVYSTQAEYFYAGYPFLLDFEYLKQLRKKQIVKTETRVLLGNSATRTNNHIEAINLIAKYKKDNIKVFVPLSYGNKEYAEKIIEYGKSVLEEKFIPLSTFIPFNEYMELLASIDIAIMNHNRQQALGSILSLLFLNKKVYMQEEVTTYQYLANLELEIFSIKDILFLEFEDLIKRNKLSSSENEKKILNTHSIDAWTKRWEKVFSSMADNFSKENKKNFKNNEQNLQLKLAIIDSSDTWYAQPRLLYNELIKMGHEVLWLARPNHEGYKETIVPQGYISVCIANNLSPIDIHTGKEMELDHPPLERAYKSNADFVFVGDNTIYNRFFKDRVGAYYMPYAVDPEVFKPIDIKEEYDVGFIGNIRLEERIRRINLIKKNFNCFIGNNLFMDKANEAFNKCKIIFNTADGKEINMRVFEALASNKLLITEEVKHLDELFQNGKHLITYKNDEEIIANIKQYLSNNEKRKEISFAGYNELLSKHTYRHRAEFIIQKVREKMSEMEKKNLTVNNSAKNFDKLKILITNHHLLDYTGSEVYTLTIAECLKKAGHEIIVYSKYVDKIKIEFDRLNIPIVQNLSEIADLKFDIAHVHHNINALEVRYHFPKLPIVFLSHGVIPFLEQPPYTEIGISKYLAVSSEVKNNLIKHGISDESITIIGNLIDSNKFKQYSPANSSPKQVLVISAKIDDVSAAKIIKACELLGLQYKFVGGRFGEVTQVQLIELINKSDLIFSLGRGIIESILCGRVVFVFDKNGGDGIVTSSNYDEIAFSNFSGRCYSKQFTVEEIVDEIKKYSLEDSRIVFNKVYKNHSTEVAIPKLIEIYSNAINNYNNQSFDSSKLGAFISSLNETKIYSTITARRENLNITNQVNYKNDLTKLINDFELRIGSLIKKSQPLSKNFESNSNSAKTYDILIPIYNAYDYAKKCIESVVNYTKEDHHIYLLDDASTDTRIFPMLKSFEEKFSNIKVLASKSNLGFIENMNRGFSISQNDVIILNSDTEVTENWVEKLDMCANSNDAIGIVSPLSNNATILSVPEFNSTNILPEGITVNKFAKIVEKCSFKSYPEIPTAVGFCMLIKRKVLNEVGFFDKAFGLGYGEENDLCERSKSVGYKIVCCDDTYIHHYGEASFSSVNQIDKRRANNKKLLEERWPNYNREIFEFCRKNPLRVIQEKIFSHLRNDLAQNKPNVLNVIHNFNAPGGTELHTQDISELNTKDFQISVIYPKLLNDYYADARSYYNDKNIRIIEIARENNLANEHFNNNPGDLSSTVIEENFTNFLIGGDYEIIHFQHLLNWSSLFLPFIAKKLNKKVVISLHDYYLLCPDINLVYPVTNKMCNKSFANPNDNDCNYCISSKRKRRNPENAPPIQNYLNIRLALVEKIIKVSDILVAPSEVVKQKFISAFGNEVGQKIEVIPHGIKILNKISVPQINDTLRIGFLGNATTIKGALILFDVVKRLSSKKIIFEIFGNVAFEFGEKLKEFGVKVHGGYHRKDLPKLLKNIHLILIPSIWEETYCLTLTEAISLGVPVLASNSGAITERIKDGINGFLFQTGDSNDLANKILTLKMNPELIKNVQQNLNAVKVKSIEENAEDYKNLYYSLLSDNNNIQTSSKQKSNNAVTFEHNINNISPLKKMSVSIILVTYNQIEYTLKCIESIERFTTIDYEIILIDNDSKDNTTSVLKNKKKITLIQNKENLGFPKAVNIGINAASSNNILILNNDTIVSENWLSRMIEVAESDPQIGIVGPVSNMVSGIQLDKNAKYNSIKEMHKYAAKIAIENKGKIQEFPRVAFLCTLIKKEVIDKIGGLDERFSPGNFEDDDFCLRAQIAGYKTVIAKDVFIHHYGSKSFTADGLDKYKERLEINKQIFVNKWGADPEEIWLKNKSIPRRNINYPINQNNFTQAFERSLILLEDKDYNEAVVELQKAIEFINEKDPVKCSAITEEELVNLTATTFFELGNIEQANKFFEKELQINPSSSRACFGLAETFYIAELYEQAKAMYEWAIKNGKNDEAAWNKLRLVNKQLNFDENNNSLDLVNIQELLQRAEEYINNDDFENALDLLDKILGTDENNIDALNDLSVIFILQNEIESALNVINKVIDLDSENEIAKNNLQVLENKIKASAVN